MRLNKLIIYGFKSFARRTEIVFPQNVTGIVGPNGSGKSNIGDAVRWVLGEQSAKLLRGNSMQDVIFNGTQTRKAMNYCEVTLVFDNTDHQLPLDYTEVSVTRRVYRSGDSEYLLNNTACRLRDVVDLFRDTGVGKEGYSIIGQGRIDEILSQRSEDRRAVFEEAAGISRFKTRKEEAEQKLKKADENLVRVLDVIEELSTHLVPLEKQADLAKEYLALSETLKELDVSLFLLRYDRTQKRVDTMEAALVAIGDTLAEAERNLSEAMSRRDARNESLEQVQQELTRAHAELLSRTDELHQAREEAQAVDNRIASAEETITRLGGEAEAVQARMMLLEASMNEQDGGLNEARRQLGQCDEELQQKKDELAQKTEAAQVFEDELTKHNNAMMEAVNRASTFKTTQARQQAMLSQMSKRLEELSVQKSEQSQKDTQLQKALQDAAESLDRESEKFETMKASSEEMTKQEKELLEQIALQQHKAQALSQEQSTIASRLKTLRELQDGYEGYQYPVKSALTWAKKQGVTGVHDVVAMLLRVPKAYEIAIDMALGGAMQNIVTSREEDAQTLIEYLRQNKLGRATFLPLSSVHGRALAGRERDVLSQTGCVGLASELCAFDEEYRGVMEYLLGRTIIVEDLDAGIRIRRMGGQGYRLVTLRGDVLHAGGSMTGGSQQGKASSLLGREREIGELERSLSGKEQEQKALLAQTEALSKQQAALRDQAKGAQYELRQQEIAVVRDTEHLRTAQEDLREHKEGMDALDGAIEQLTQAIGDVEAELRRIEERSQVDAPSQADMDRRTEELSQSLGKARREREAAQEAATAAMLRQQEAAHAVEQVLRDQKRILGDRESSEKQYQELLFRREQTKLSLDQLASQREDRADKIGKAERLLAQQRALTDELEYKREQEQKLLKEEQSEIDACQQQVSRETDRQHRQELTLSKARGELTLLTDRLWDTYELTYAGAKELETQLLEQQASSRGENDPAPMPFNEDKASGEAQQIRDRIREMGTVNVGAIEEYAQMRERYTVLKGQQDDLEKAKADLGALIEQLLSKMEEVFVSQFGLLQGYFSTTFTRLFGGGHGEVQLSDPNDPLNCGIEIIVQPPGKKRQILSLFSGGERALTAIAILFAMLMLKPTPFCILDEIEAALDEANIGYFADYLKEFSKDTQFVVVTHRKGTMERCDTLFGVSMEERGISTMVSVNLTEYE